MSARQRRCQPWLGTFVTIEAQCANSRATDRAIDMGFAAIARVHRLMSPHDTGSDVSRLNRAPVGAPIEVDAWTAEVLLAAQAFGQSTGGAFGVGFPSRPGRAAACTWRRPGYAITGTTAMRTAAVRLDLGGIAKGYAVDRAVEALLTAEASAGCVNAGGDMRFFGEAPRSLAIRHPLAPERTITIGTIRNGACASSYFGARIAALAGGGLIDARTGNARSAGLVTVLAPDCMRADALTKVAALLGNAADAVLVRYEAEVIRTPEPDISEAIDPA